MLWWSVDFKITRLLILFDMFLNPSFKMTTSFPNVARTTAFFYWDSLHARLGSHYEAWSYKKKKHKKIRAHKKSV